MTTPVAGPFYFAWVDPTDTTFNSEFYRMDEYIFSARRTLSEGQKPLLEIEIQNPGVGLLSSGRKKWAWFAWDRNYFTGSGGIEPLFFGRIVGAPVAIDKQTFAIQLIASPEDYKQRVQLVAEGLKVLPYWDPVFIDIGKRDDPDTILETRAAFWDVDPITHAVTSVGIVDGPDGNVNVTDHFYDSLDITVSQPPATAILMDASVSWTQSGRGVLDPLAFKAVSYGGDGIIGDWPKPGTQLGGGYSVLDSDAKDNANAQQAEIVSMSWSYQNKEKTHEDGDTMSASWSISVPMGGAIGAQQVLSYSSQTGVVDPFAVDGDGDPSPLNIPASYSDSTAYAMLFNVSATITLEYVCARPRTERVKFLVRADMQDVIVEPTLDQDSETMTLNGADVGMPILKPLNWYSVAGTFVPVNTIVFPDNPSLPGSQTAQIATASGVAGIVEPNFSDTPGFTTTDGGVTWASLGVSTPRENANDWAADTNIPAGTIILPKKPFSIPLYALMRAGLNQFPPDKNPEVSAGQIIDNRVCTLGGGYFTDATFWDTTLPDGHSFWVALNSGRTGPEFHIPPFGASAVGTQVVDGSIVWQCVGSGDIPIGGALGEQHASSYFATDRGRRSLEYLGLRTRSRLLWRGRCADVSFDTTFAEGVQFTTRKTATVNDTRLPGGVAVGKVKSAVLTVGGDGAASCHVTTGCTLGKANEAVAVAGTNVYADSYVADGYQVLAGQYLLLPNGSDLAYAPPVYLAEDDGLVFPLTPDQVVVSSGVRGSLTAQAGAVGDALEAMAAAQKLPPATDLNTAFDRQQQAKILQSNSVPKAIKNHPVWIEIVLKPLTGTFHKLYNVKFSNLTMGKGIDLGGT